MPPGNDTLDLTELFPDPDSVGTSEYFAVCSLLNLENEETPILKNREGVEEMRDSLEELARVAQEKKEGLEKLLNAPPTPP